jgi:hypothetical protein
MKVTVTIELGKHTQSISSDDNVGYGNYYSTIKSLGELAMSHMVREIELVQDGVLELIPDIKKQKESI